jgi:hypothetical protein
VHGESGDGGEITTGRDGDLVALCAQRRRERNERQQVPGQRGGDDQDAHGRTVPMINRPRRSTAR